MNSWKALCMGLVTLASLSGRLAAQPAAPAPPDLAGPSTGVDPGGLAKFLGISKDQKEARKRRCCKNPLMQLINNGMAPMRAMTGGALGNCCPTTPSQQDQAQPGVQGVCAKIKADEAGVRARRAAVKCVGSADCHYWPEAEAALIATLRGDRNECVRWDAAVALGGGCCCTQKTMEALLISATGSDRDGNPGETCPRVRAAAYTSLQHCLACFSQEVPGEPKKGIEVPKPEKPEPVKPTAANTTSNSTSNNSMLTAYYANLGKKPMQATVEESRKVSESFSVEGDNSPGVNLPTGHRGLFNIVMATVSVPTGSRRTLSEGTVEPGTVMATSPSTGEPAPVVDRTPFRDPMPSRPIRAFGTGFKQGQATTAEYHPASPVPPAVTPVPASITPMPTPAPVPAMPIVPATTTTPVPQQQSHATPAPGTTQLMLVLRNSAYPFQREWAVNELSGVDWRGNPEVVQALLNAAQRDSAATVRVACVKAIVKMQVDTVPVAMTMQAMKTDADPRVQREAVAALGQMHSVQTVSATPAVLAGGRPNATIVPAYQRALGPTSSGVQPAGNAFSQ